MSLLNVPAVLIEPAVEIEPAVLISAGSISTSRLKNCTAKNYNFYDLFNILVLPYMKSGEGVEFYNKC